MLNSGTLYIVATPIGHLEDLSPRAQQVLKTVKLIAAEDTRHSRVLLNHYGINTPCISFHDFNEKERIHELLDQLEQGADIALISDAGTPLISDPGFKLVLAARTQEFKVVPIPGPCALITALSASGLPSDRFIFEGFLSAKRTHRLKQLTALLHETRTVIFYEAPHRILATLEDCIAVFGKDRQAVIARELSKTFETILSGTLNGLHDCLTRDVNQQKGEFVLLLHGAKETDEENTSSALEVLKILLSELPVSQAARIAAKITGEKKSRLYEKALELSNEERGPP